MQTEKKKKIKEKSSNADCMFVYVENLKEWNSKPTPRTDQWVLQG